MTMTIHESTAYQSALRYFDKVASRGSPEEVLMAAQAVEAVARAAEAAYALRMNHLYGRSDEAAAIAPARSEKIVTELRRGAAMRTTKGAQKPDYDPPF